MIYQFFFFRQHIERQSEDEFEDFDEVDDVQRCATNENQIQPTIRSDLDSASKDLLQRLLEVKPQHRLKSLLALSRIAFFHNYNFDDVRHMKVRMENELDCKKNCIWLNGRRSIDGRRDKH